MINQCYFLEKLQILKCTIINSNTFVAFVIRVNAIPKPQERCDPVEAEKYSTKIFDIWNINVDDDNDKIHPLTSEKLAKEKLPGNILSSLQT